MRQTHTQSISEALRLFLLSASGSGIRVIQHLLQQYGTSACLSTKGKTSGGPECTRQTWWFQTRNSKTKIMIHPKWFTLYNNIVGIAHCTNLLRYFLNVDKKKTIAKWRRWQTDVMWLKHIFFLLAVCVGLSDETLLKERERGFVCEIAGSVIVPPS